MGRIYKDILVPIPAEASASGGQVFISFYDAGGTRHRQVIGIAADEASMHPNDSYRALYPVRWKQHAPDAGAGRHTAPRLHAGLYALGLGAGRRTGLYPLLLKSFGPEYANDIMDFCLYSLREAGCAQPFQQEMAEQLRFGRVLRSDAYFAGLFNLKLSGFMLRSFQAGWLELCREKGLKAVWLCADKAAPADQSFCCVRAVSAADGRPAACFLLPDSLGGALPDTLPDASHDAPSGRPGGSPDEKAGCQTLQDVTGLLAKAGIEVQGLIAGSSAASPKLLAEARKCGLDCLLVLDAASSGFAEMLGRHGAGFKNNVDFLVAPDPVFGITGEARIFADSSESFCTGLFYDPLQGAQEASRIVGSIWKAARGKLEAGLPDAGITDALQQHLVPAREGGRMQGAAFSREACQKAVDRAGCFACASTCRRTAEEIFRLYRLYSRTERQFAVFRSQIASDAFKGLSAQGRKACLAASFAACILRTEAEHVCLKLGLDAAAIIRELDTVYFTLLPKGSYLASCRLSSSLKDVLAAFGIREEHFEKLVQEVNTSGTSVIPMERESPSLTEPAREEAKHRGRKKGGKNLKTLEREAREKAEEAAGLKKEPRGPGRPKGSKNKKTLERERLLLDAAGSSAAEGRQEPDSPRGCREGPLFNFTDHR